MQRFLKYQHRPRIFQNIQLAKATSTDPYAISDDESLYIEPPRGRGCNFTINNVDAWNMSKNDGSIEGEQPKFIKGRLDWAWLSWEEYTPRAIQRVEKWLISENVQRTASKRPPGSNEPNSNKEQQDSTVINGMGAFQVVENDQRIATERLEKTDKANTFFHPLNWLSRKNPNLNKERHDSMVIKETKACRVAEDDRRIATESLQKLDESNANMSSLHKLLNEMIIEEAESWRVFENERLMRDERLQKLDESNANMISLHKLSNEMIIEEAESWGVFENGRLMRDERLEKLDESNLTQNDPQVIDETEALRQKLLENNLLIPYPYSGSYWGSWWDPYEAHAIKNVEKWFAENESYI